MVPAFCKLASVFRIFGKEARRISARTNWLTEGRPYITIVLMLMPVKSTREIRNYETAVETNLLIVLHYVSLEMKP